MRWPTVVCVSITNNMTSTPNVANDGTNFRVTLIGLAVTESQIRSDLPNKFIRNIMLPQTFELVGYDGSSRAVVMY